jgi:hypothetical protein
MRPNGHTVVLPEPSDWERPSHLEKTRFAALQAVQLRSLRLWNE